MKLKISGNIELETIDEQPRLVFSVKIGGTVIRDIKMLILPIDKKVPAHVQPVDAAGNPAQVEGAPVWTSSAENIVTVTASGDGLQAEITPLGALGTAQINVSADADLGSGVTTIIGVLDVQTVAGEAVSLQIQTGEAVPQSKQKKK